jgi:hypothetical protein
MRGVGLDAGGAEGVEIVEQARAFLLAAAPACSSRRSGTSTSCRPEDVAERAVQRAEEGAAVLFALVVGEGGGGGDQRRFISAL